MSDIATTTLHWLAGAMLIPDIVMLIGFAAFCLISLGGLAGEAWRRHRFAPQWRGFIARLAADPSRRWRLPEAPAGLGVVDHALRLIAAAPGGYAHILDLTQLEVECRLDRLLLGIRLGPILGLAGTLIPLGPTLLALTKWDLSALSSQLVIAFNATIVGLFIGGTCYAIHLVRRRWYRADLTDLEYALPRLEAEPCAISA